MTLSCAETEARFVDVIDGRLEPPVEMRVHAHLEGCAACRAKAELWRTLVPALRALTPRPPAELAARRIEVEVLRRLHGAGAAPARARRWGMFAAAFTLAGAAAGLGFWLHAAGPRKRTPAQETAYALVTGVVGTVTSGGRPLAPATPLAAGGEVEVGAAGVAELRLDRGSVLRLRGPARLALGGTAREVALGLASGTLEAQVAHRLAGETFAVATRDVRVEVRGTHFTVGAEPDRSWVRVEEGRVAVRGADGSERTIGAGEAASFGGPAAEPAAAPDAPPAAAPACGAALRSCEGVARTARESMRGGDNERAVRLVAAASRSLRDADASCGRALGGCDDELRYLRAEALRGAGRFDDAIAAYRALNRAGAPAVTRQNALYAAAELERRRGRTATALADYEGALAAAPRGVLHEEALVGAMETADRIGDRARAVALARRYLAELPDGRARALARRLVGGDAPGGPPVR